MRLSDTAPREPAIGRPSASAPPLFERLGDHIARLPLGWFEAGRVGSVGRLTSQGVIDVMGVPAHLLRPVVTSFVTPATVILLMFAFDWRLALAALVTAPVAALVYRWFGNLVQRTDHRTDAAAVEAAGRIVEYAQAQAVLRAFGRATQGFRQLDDALREQRNAGRAQILTAAPGLAVFVLVVQLAFTILLLFGTSLALGGEIDAPELLAMLVLGARYVEPLVAAADLGGALRGEPQQPGAHGCPARNATSPRAGRRGMRRRREEPTSFSMA